MSRPPSNESLARKVDVARQTMDKAIELWKDLISEVNNPELRENLQRVVERLEPLSIESSKIFLATFFTSLLRNDPALKERRRIYQELGKVLAERLKVSSKEGLLTSYYLIGQEDLSDLVEDSVIPAAPEALLEQARKVLVEATLQYTKPISEKPGMVYSVIKLDITDPTHSPLRFRRVEIPTDLDHDVLPQEIREKLIRGDHPVTYTLFPQERD